MADETSWRDLAVAALAAAAPKEKCAAAARAFEVVSTGSFRLDGEWVAPPDAPARPERPILLPPQAAPRRRLGSLEGRIALLHALAHIELNAVDLAFDMAARFEGEIAAAGLDRAAFIRDWFAIGAEEARHFAMLDDRLSELGSAYGELPAHGALWESAARTADSVLARLAVAPMVLEARGLDVTPQMARRLRLAGDAKSAEILDEIYRDEIGHVAAGARWFDRVCNARGIDPATEFARLVSERFSGGLKPPFNREGRSAAGLPERYYSGWNGPCEESKAPEAQSR
ncbi:MAG: ferritin-like domain-containing protein [Pseudomonadota bacterium]